MNEKSYVYFRNGEVVDASNDGMELLGHFLLTQVALDVHFFDKWLEDSRDAAISSSSYYLEKKGDEVILSHLNNDLFVPFVTTRAIFMDLVKRWEQKCLGDINPICGPDGVAMVLRRLDEGKKFTLEHA